MQSHIFFFFSIFLVCTYCSLLSFFIVGDSCLSDISSFVILFLKINICGDSRLINDEHHPMQLLLSSHPNTAIRCMLFLLYHSCYVWPWVFHAAFKAGDTKVYGRPSKHHINKNNKDNGGEETQKCCVFLSHKTHNPKLQSRLVTFLTPAEIHFLLHTDLAFTNGDQAEQIVQECQVTLH